MCCTPLVNQLQAPATGSITSAGDDGRSFKTEGFRLSPQALSSERTDLFHVLLIPIAHPKPRAISCEFTIHNWLSWYSHKQINRNSQLGIMNYDRGDWMQQRGGREDNYSR